MKSISPFLKTNKLPDCIEKKSNLHYNYTESKIKPNLLNQYLRPTYFFSTVINCESKI